MEMSALPLGSQLQGGKYRINKVLGQGGFGITYEAEQVSLGRKVAVKEFFMKDLCNRDESTSHVSVPSVGSKELVERFRQKFIREARTIAGLDNDHIVRIYDVFEENGTAYYVMEYLSGGSLDRKIRECGALSEEKAVGYIRQIADALQYLHSRSILHFDVKPSNVLQNENGIVKLIDFGISKHYDENGSQTSSTPVGISKGFAPLEQYQQGGDIRTFTPATDIYSLGATLFALVAGGNPPEASVVGEEGLPAKPSNVSEDLWKAVGCAMSFRRKDRPQSVAEFLGLLDGTAKEDNSEVTVVPGAELQSKTTKSGKEKKTAGSETQEQQHGQKESKEPKPALSARRFPMWLLGVLGGLVVAAAVYFIGIRSRQAPVDPVIKLNQTEAAVTPRKQDVQPSKQPETSSVSTSSTASSPTTGTNNGHEWVDLGLSVKWATCNVGASSPSDYGSYFAWGETSPKDKYTWSNLKYCNDTAGDSFSKYNQNQGGTKDNKTTLDLSDDAARANWGGSWRMPTISEFEELIGKCTWTWTTMNGKNGYKVVSKVNGHSIFLPAAGYRYATSLLDAGSYGTYWSSSLYESGSYYARGIYFNSVYHGTDDNGRRSGQSVRPVLR